MRLHNDFATARVPATSANLGPGYDSFGVALDLRDQVSVRAVPEGTRVTVRGTTNRDVPDGEDNLIVKAIRRGLAYLDGPQVGLQLECHNRIPHGAGLGSSAAAIVAGLSLAGALAGQGSLSQADLFELATQMEGHPDNVAPAIYGGVTISWMVEDGRGARTVALPPPANLTTTVLIPDYRLPTKQARAALPPKIPHVDAARNTARASVLALVLAGVANPKYLLDATEDYLHQRQRAQVMPATWELVTYLRKRSYPAVISGAGPAVLVLSALPEELTEDAQAAGWKVLSLPLNASGVQAEGSQLSN